MTTRLVYAPIQPVATLRENEPEKAQAFDVTRAIFTRRLEELQQHVSEENVNTRILRSWTALMFAVHKNRPACIDFLLSVGADVNMADQKSRTVYHMATELGRDEVLLQLLQAVHQRGEEVMIDVFDEYGTTPLMVAAGKGYDDVVQILLDNGANIHLKDRSKMQTALHMAAAKGHARAVEVLLRHHDQPVVNEQDADGETALLRACANDQVEVVRLLYQLSRGAPPDCNLRDAAGRTAIMYAMWGGHHKIVECLMVQTPEPDLWMLGPPLEDTSGDDELSLLQLTNRKYRNKESYTVVKQSLHTMIISALSDNAGFRVLEEIAQMVAFWTY